MLEKPMVRIEYAEIRGDFQTLWLRYVKGINLNIGSMRCLKGHVDRRIHSGMLKIKPMELEESPFYYLCALDRQGALSEDLHLAFVEAPGEEILIDDDRISLKITGARRIPIDLSKAIRNNHSQEAALSESPFWLFASYLAANSGIPREPMRYKPGRRNPRWDRNMKRPAHKPEPKPELKTE